MIKTTLIFSLFLFSVLNCASSILHSSGSVDDYVRSSPYMGHQSVRSSVPQNTETESYEDFEADAPITNDVRSSIMQEAKAQLGVPYKFGGNSPSGFDCSGLTSYVYKRSGLTLPRSASAQFSALPVIKKPQPGDLVFFKTDGNNISHVGIYMGNLKMIHAPSSGKNVEMIEMNNPYWKPRYAGARSLPN
ncbi:MAG: C40 family peptidase [Leptospiraceae bacterium]|nr:C40 family peptidase [Leptospiraceae bacterium]MCB1201968.1 C40 family peptidase [Leptospiraceae bacterium]